MAIESEIGEMFSAFSGDVRHWRGDLRERIVFERSLQVESYLLFLFAGCIMVHKDTSAMNRLLLRETVSHSLVTLNVFRCNSQYSSADNANFRSGECSAISTIDCRHTYVLPNRARR